MADKQAVVRSRMVRRPAAGSDVRGAWAMGDTPAPAGGATDGGGKPGSRGRESRGCSGVGRAAAARVDCGAAGAGYVRRIPADTQGIAVGSAVSTVCGFRMPGDRRAPSGG